MLAWLYLPKLYRPVYVHKLASPGYTFSVGMDRSVTTTYVRFVYLVATDRSVTTTYVHFVYLVAALLRYMKSNRSLVCRVGVA